MRKKLFTVILLFLIFAFALFLRVYFSYDKVFSVPIKYAADDGVYHMRLVENMLLGKHILHRIYFDPFTYFPYGTYNYFAPLYDYFLAGIIWIAALGKPTLALINKIAPFYPAILGSLMIFLAYFIGKTIWNKKTGLVSSFLMAVSQPYLYKSLLGANDHHVAETLFSAIAMLFLILLCKERKNWFKNKKFWLFTILAGLTLGLYFLIWSGALLFLFIIFVFIVLYYLIQYFFGRPENWILIAGSIIFLITLAMIFPFFGHPDLFHSPAYNIQYLIFGHYDLLGPLIFGILIFIFLAISSEFFQRKKINRKFFPIFLIVFLILFLLILKSFFPLLFGGIVQNFRAISIGISPQPLARELVSEMIPLGFQGAFARFSTLFYLSLISLFIILYDFIKERKPECLLIFVWTLIIILMAGIIPLIGQQRFAYYLSFNISILSGFLIVKGFEFGWQGLKKTQAISQGSSIQPYLLVGSILIIFNSIFFLFFPFPLNIFNSYPNNLPDILRLSLVAAREGTFIRESNWYDSLNWLKENTPDPGVDYYALYKEPGIDKVRGEINPYLYPETAYGVLARWDVGHMITYYSHRLPNSNPFHQGVGKKKDGEIVELGETVFFLENKEEKAIEYLDELKTRYVITDYLSANPELTFKSMVKWFEGSLEDYYLQEGEEIGERASKFDNSMIVRLHILDGREKILKREVKGEEKEFYIEPLAHFRLVYESEKTVGFSKEDPNDVTKAIKIFEYIKGAKIKGKAPDNMTVVVSTKIKTNQEREFTYQKTIVAKNGYFEFVLPYSTYGEKGRLPGQTQFSVFASPYQLKIGDKKIEVNITEEDILEGREIEIVN